MYPEASDWNEKADDGPAGCRAISRIRKCKVASGDIKKME